MTAGKQLWMLVGGNGAGKSTFYRLYLERQGLPFVNADILARLAYPHAPEGHSYEAARLAEQQRNTLLISGSSFCFETVYSHPSKIDFLARAKALRYQVILVMIHLASAQLNRARIAERVAEGGHGVPDEKVTSGIPRMLEHVRMSLALCDLVRVYDNSFSDNPFIPVLSIEGGRVEQHLDSLPDWAKALLDGI